MTFGAIDFYTKYFERFKASPEAFVVAGVIEILGAWALWAFTHRLVRR